MIWPIQLCIDTLHMLYFCASRGSFVVLARSCSHFLVQKPPVAFGDLGFKKRVANLKKQYHAAMIDLLNLCCWKKRTHTQVYKHFFGIYLEILAMYQGSFCKVRSYYSISLLWRWLWGHAHLGPKGTFLKLCFWKFLFVTRMDNALTVDGILCETATVRNKTHFWSVVS